VIPKSTAQQSFAHATKILSDLKAREEEREFREAEIRKEFTLFDKKSFFACDKAIRKIVRKMLLLTIEKQQPAVTGSSGVS
jgi:hypothetical protein